LWLEEYLYGVVPWEMPSSWHPEALKAQAIVARSYAVNQKIRRRAGGNYYDICATTSCQVYGGYSAEHSSSNAAVNATEGRVATHPDSGTTANGVILAVFSSSSGGATENNTDGFGSSTQYPYLRSVSDPWSLDSAANNPYSSWETSVSSSTVASKVGLDSVSTIRVVERNVSGSADTLAFTGVKNGARTTVNRSGLWARSTFGLRSIFIHRVFTPPFYDDDGSIHEADIVAVWREGITGGCGDARFCPDAGLTRGQMASLLARARNLPATTQDYFTDDDGSLYEADINRLAAAGYTAGCEAERFCPKARVTRSQLMSFLASAFSSVVPAATTTDYFDDDNGSTHEVDINRMAAGGFTGGCGPARTFCPSQEVTRAQTASFLARVMSLP
jgi:SpoIID/LytB domain protein